jgi:hypothetical protein
MANVFKRTLIYFLMGSFALVIALAWNTAFTNMIQKIFPQNKKLNITGQFIYALTLTIVFVSFSILLVGKIVEKEFLHSFNRSIFLI